MKLECVWQLANLTFNAYACEKLVEGNAIQSLVNLLLEN